MALGFLSALADDLLATVEEALAEAHTGHSPPDGYVSHSIPAVDQCCPGAGGGYGGGILVVYFDPDQAVEIVPPPNFGLTPSTAQGCVAVPVANLCVELWRCVPALKGSQSNPFPSSTVLDESAANLLEDLWALLDGILDNRQTGTLFDGIGECQAVEVGSALALGPQGGCAGWKVCVRVEIPGSARLAS